MLAGGRESTLTIPIPTSRLPARNRILKRYQTYFLRSVSLPDISPPQSGGMDGVYADAATLVVYSGHGSVSSSPRKLAMSKAIDVADGGGVYVGSTTPCDVELSDLHLGALAGSRARIVIYDSSCTGHSSDLLAGGPGGAGNFDFRFQNENNLIWQYLAFADSPVLGTWELTATGPATGASSNLVGWLAVMANPEPGFYNQPIVYTTLDAFDSYQSLDSRHFGANYLTQAFIPGAPPTAVNGMRATSSMTQDDPFGDVNNDPTPSACN
jgi:hypothetical protein